MIRITREMLPEQRAISYVKNAIEVTEVNIYGDLVDYLYPITKYIESILTTKAERYRNRVDNTRQIIDIIQYIKDEHYVGGVIVG